MRTFCKFLFSRFFVIDMTVTTKHCGIIVEMWAISIQYPWTISYSGMWKNRYTDTLMFCLSVTETMKPLYDCYMGGALDMRSDGGVRTGYGDDDDFDFTNKVRL